MTPVRTAQRLLPLLIVVALAGGACSSGSTDLASKTSGSRSSSTTAADPTDSEPAGPLRWSRCTDELAAAAGLRCATLKVPVDPAEPNGPKISIALAKQPATGPDAGRIGSLVMNPGGPGASGIEFLANAAGQLPDEVAEKFDLVSFDPRGIGASSPVRCLTDRQKDQQFAGDLSPDTPAEVEKAFEDTAEFRNGCASRSAELLTHMSTADVAEDVEQIRIALGDDKLTFLGFSYGTSIAATYATLHPDKVRALVLDGSVSPDAGDEATTLAQIKGFERTLGNFVAACNTSTSCALAPDAAGAIDAARASLADDPVEVGSGTKARTLGPDQFDIGLATALYDDATWGVAASAVKNLRGGGARTLLSLADQQTGRQPDGSYDNSSDAQTMVACNDSAERPSRDEAVAAANRISAQVPGFGNAIGWSVLGCLDWPLASNPLPAPRAPGSAPLLVIGTVGDPATPYEWSVAMAGALGSATLLTYEGTGHTAFLRGGPCVDDAVVRYLVDLKVPAAGTRCPAVAEGSGFGGIRDEIV
ncbi:MAG: alpha/beta hydrolase, partial [Actinomycetes bacterium]